MWNKWSICFYILNVKQIHLFLSDNNSEHEVKKLVRNKGQDVLYFFHCLINFLFPFSPEVAELLISRPQATTKLQFSWRAPNIEIYLYPNIVVVLQSYFSPSHRGSTPPAPLLTRKTALTKELFIVVSVVQAAK